MIPKIIWQTYESSFEELPKEAKNLVTIWKEKNPEWEFIMWNNKMILQLLEKYPKLYTLYKNIHTLLKLHYLI